MQFIMRIKFLPRVKIKYDNSWNWFLRGNPNLTTPNFSHKTATFKELKTIIMESFEIDNDEAKRLLHRNPILLTMSIDHINHNCEMCKNQNIDMRGTPNNLKFLEFSEQQLEDRILLLKEMGAININTTMISSCAGRVHMVTFKAFSLIPKGEIISEKLYSFLHVPPSEVPALEPISEFITVNEYRKKCLIHYIKWRLEIPESNESLLKSISHRLRHRSFSKLKQSFDILHDDIGMTIDMIRDNRCLELTSPTDLRRILEEMLTICGMSIKELIFKHPELHKMRYKNVSVAKVLLEKNNFSSEQVDNSPRVLLIDHKILKEGLDTIITTPELKILVEHPKVLEILLTKDGVSRRIQYMKYLSMKDSTVGILGSTLSVFERFLKLGVYRHKSREICITLEKHVQINSSAIEAEMKKHPFWKHVELLTILETLEYLQSVCDIRDIQQNLQILLYSKETVEKTFTELMAMNEMIDDKDRYPLTQLLSLCAYQIEKKYHFTGDGVWDKNPVLKVSDNQKELLKDTDEWNKFRDKYPLNDVNNFIFINTNKNQKSK